jgi:circadian clock protein KaiB
MDAFPAPADLLPLTGPEFELVLFITGSNARAVQALRNVEQLCAQHLAGRYSLTVVDVSQHPERAVEEQLVGLPCLLKKRPGLVRRLVGDFADEARVLKALGLSPG